MDDPIEAVVGSEPLFAEIAFPELSSGQGPNFDLPSICHACCSRHHFTKAAAFCSICSKPCDLMRLLSGSRHVLQVVRQAWTPQ